MSRPASRVHRARVEEVRQLTPHFTRITFAGEDLCHFGSGGFDQRVKLLFPHADGTWTDVGLFDESDDVAGWYHRWRDLPQERRNAMRTYTIRSARPNEGQVDVDFALHGTTGPASAWALSASVGDEVAIVGPDARSDLPGGGVEWCPGDARRVLLVADESAAPAVASILEALPAHITGHAFVEVPGPGDVLPLTTVSGVEVHWLPRGAARRGAPAVDAVTQLREGVDYAWLAGEAGVVTTLRRHLVRDVGMDRSCVTFMGYWKQGQAEN